MIPVIERMERVDLRTVTMDVPAQDVITRDNVSVKVNAVLYFRVIDPSKARSSRSSDYLFATSQLAQTTLRSVCGQAELDELLAEREKINTHMQEILDRRPIRGASRSSPSRSSTSICRRRCSAPWRGRPRRSASDAPR